MKIWNIDKPNNEMYFWSYTKNSFVIRLLIVEKIKPFLILKMTVSKQYCIGVSRIKDVFDIALNF